MFLSAVITAIRQSGKLQVRLLEARRQGNPEVLLIDDSYGDARLHWCRRIYPRYLIWIGKFVLLMVLAGCSILPTSSNTPAVEITPLTLSPRATNSPVPAVSNVDWTTYHRDNIRTDYLANVPDPQSLTRLWSTRLDVAVHPDPLVVRVWLLLPTEFHPLYPLMPPTRNVPCHRTISV